MGRANRPPGAESTMTNPEYMNLRNAADVAIRTTFPDDLYVGFRKFADWLEKALFKAFAKGELLPFEDFYSERDKLISQLLDRLWD